MKVIEKYEICYPNPLNLNAGDKIELIKRGPLQIPNSNLGICQIKDPFGNTIGLQGKYSTGETD